MFRSGQLILPTNPFERADKASSYGSATISSVGRDDRGGFNLVIIQF